MNALAAQGTVQASIPPRFHPIVGTKSHVVVTMIPSFKSETKQFHSVDSGKDGGEGVALPPKPIQLPKPSMKVSPGNEYEFVFGRRHFHLLREAKACWTLSTFKYPPVELPEGQEPEPVIQNRFATNGSQESADFCLGGSVIPLLVKFQKGGVSIFPGDHATLMFLAPVFLRITLKGHEKHPLHDGPCRSMSKAWSGTNVEGEEAHEWKTPLLWEPPSEPPPDDQWDLACCTVEIHNHQDTPLKFDRLTINLASSPVFEGGGWLWTGLFKVRNYGGVKGTEVSQTGKVPDVAGKVKEVYPPRNPSASSGGLVSLGLGSIVGSIGVR